MRLIQNGMNDFVNEIEYIEKFMNIALKFLLTIN